MIVTTIRSIATVVNLDLVTKQRRALSSPEPAFRLVTHRVGHIRKNEKGSRHSIETVSARLVSTKITP